MNQSQKSIVDKLNKDNKFLAEGHKSWISYSKGRILINILIVLVLLLLILSQ
ncbi:hypothetical protein WKT02_07035 [Erysipelotrichaceae bacterium HCN-30851]